MNSVLSKLRGGIRTLCQPNPKVYTNPETHQAMWNRNMTSTYTSLIYNILSVIFTRYSGYSDSANQFQITASILVFLAFIILCRSYRRVFHYLYALFVIFLGSIVLEKIPDSQYVWLGHTFVLLPYIMTACGDIKLAVFLGAFQIYTYFVKFKQSFIYLVRETEPEIFADKFVKTILFWFIITLMYNISLVKAIEKSSKELSVTKCALEVALDHQKTFIYSFSHELRNPINSLLGNLQLVLQGEILSTKATQMIRVAKVCGEVLLHGINNVLETGKHDIGKLEVNPVPTRIQELFERTWGIYEELLKQKKLESKVKIDKTMPPVLKIDAHKVNQVLLNLIGNSIKFTQHGSITVACNWLKEKEVNDECFEPKPFDEEDEGIFEKDENMSGIRSYKFSRMKSNLIAKKELVRSERRVCTQEQGEEEAGVLKIIVKDTGSGMKKEALDQLFKKFSQVSENISERQIGTGLGLFITREICQTMNGEIRAYSRFGVGSAFVVCIPTISLPFNAIQRADYDLIMKQLSERRLKALVADDSPFNVDLISEYFSKFGGSMVSIAYNGYDAFIKYKETRKANLDIDCVVLDIDMPLMNGKMVCEKIRQFERENRLKPAVIILMSGNYDKEKIEDYVDPRNGNKADCFLKKPVSFDEFSCAIYNLTLV